MTERLCLYLMICVMAVSAACDRRELTYDYHPYCDVTVEADWTEFGETPMGMTVIFYPTDGSKAVTQTTNSVHTTKVSLREGRYNILLFNQSPGEFGTIGFRGLDSYATAEVFAQESDTSKGWYSKAEGEVVAVEPEHFGVAVFEGFEVTKEMIDVQKTNRIASRSTVTLTPKNVVADGSIIVHVKGIHNLRAVRGSISGMAAGFRMGAFANSEETVTHLLEQWRIVADEGNPTEGVITTDYSTFGMPGMKLNRLGAGVRSAVEGMFAHAILDLSLLLVDNQTVMRERFQVKDHIEVAEATGNVVLTLEIVEAFADPDNPDAPLVPVRPGDTPTEGGSTTSAITLPDVKPEGGSSSGFDATVDDWGEEENVEVEL